MHTKIHSSKSVVKRCRWLVALASGLLVGHSALAAVTFTITPSAVSNTYSGLITLSIGGLTNTETVVVQKFLDLNTNGVIDGTDGLVQQFNLTDGQAGMVIGGVTNFNVPGDLNATPGAVTAQLNFQNGDFVQNIIGKYLFKLSSPVGHFAPLTNQFAVTNFPFAQKFTGLVVSNSTSTTVSNAIVLLFPPPQPGNKGPSGPPLAGAVANNAGSYTVQAPPGTYTLVSFRNNFLANMNTAPVLTLAGSQTITTNLTLTNATSSITGKIMDANNASIGLPGMISAMSANGLLAISFTDTNGNFNMPVTAGTWKIKAEDTTLIVHGYLGLQNGINVTAGATGLTLTVPKATALIYGSVKDNLGNPLVGLDVYANDNNNLYYIDGYTDASGNYVLGVLGLGSSDSWHVQANGNNQLTNYIFAQENINGNINAGQAVLQNFTAILAPNHITGNVKFNGNPVSGVGVNANATIGVAGYQSYVDTDNNGNYSLNVANGNWNISVNCNGRDASLDNILGNGNYQCPGNDNVTINNNNGTANFTVQPCGGVQIFTTSLPDGQVGSYYNQFLQGSSCSGNLNWSLNDPQNFPSSLGWSGNGNIQGTPNSSGTYNFSVTLNDGNGHSTNQNLSLYIAGVSSPLQVTTTYLPDGTNGTFYTQTIQASGGQMPYSWSIAGYSALPSSLTLATNGVLSGTLADTVNTYYFDVIVTDAAANSSTNTLALTLVNPPLPPLVITNVSLPNGLVGTAYSAQLGATGGQSPYYWTYALGSINLSSVGLSLSPSGLISGTPTTNKVPTFKVQVRDSNPGLANTTTKVLSIIINPQPLLGSPTWLTNQFQMRLIGASNQNYTVQMSTNLSFTNWISLFITNNTTTNSFLLTDPNATNQQRFYRILIGP